MLLPASTGFTAVCENLVNNQAPKPATRILLLAPPRTCVMTLM